MIKAKNILIEPETCPRCGSRFTCSKSGKCWCFSVAVSEEIRAAMELKYDHCLCPTCLKEVSEKGL